MNPPLLNDTISDSHLFFIYYFSLLSTHHNENCSHPIEEADDYEYGAVDAPIGLAWGAGILVIATALLPLAMQGGEEAFEEMRQKDADSWGTGNSDRLNKRK
jgi:hypothetical protein